MTVQNWKFEVVASEVGLRLDQLVAVRTGLSRRKVREILKLGGIQVGKKRVRVASKEVAPGTEVRVALDDSLGAPPDLEVPVVFEDAWLLVVNKPAGLPTQGTQASDQHDLLALLGRQRPGQRLILCHRLDQGTSGVLVLAKDPKADLGAQFQERTLGKVYLARIAGPLAATTVDRPIGRLRLAKPARFGCGGDVLEPKPSTTLLRPASAEETLGLVPGHWVVAEPRTGRTHQIRVHLAHLGRPVVGDGLYGGEPSDRLWLHAWKLRLKHPVTGEDLELVAAPKRFQEQPA
jgi:23S rRNA pseudouridine1911/1915/1917 synthase